MAPVVKTAWLATSVARLTGDPGRDASEGKRYRVRFTTADGHAVSVQVDTHPTDTRPYVLNQIADVFKVERQNILSVLKDWSPEQLKTHLGQFSKADLMPPNYRR